MKDRSVFVGSLVAGVLASACCIGPLVLGVLGLSSLGLGAALAPLRPWFLGVTAAFLTIGFYFAYRPQRAEACAPGEACAKPVSRRGQRIGLWVVTVATVALASYPNWGARLTTSHNASAASPAANAVVALDVHGMTCSACAGEIEGELRKVPGVVQATVSYERRRAEIRLSAAQPRVQPLIAAVEKAGYHATPANQ
ncbi:MAG: cation transporter [Candidatus Eisenbacteria bacterium]|nr:cation transporter [Candidatus Eisenbacteria bacterium]